MGCGGFLSTSSPRCTRVRARTRAPCECYNVNAKEEEEEEEEKDTTDLKSVGRNLEASDVFDIKSPIWLPRTLLGYVSRAYLAMQCSVRL
jgi:hypothetical protein